MISLIHDPTLAYPGSEDFYSPDESYPEYRLGHISAQKNTVYAAVRRCFAQAHLDEAHLGTEEWNPLRDYVAEGSKVFVLCNFMLQRGSKESVENFMAKCNHASVLRAVLDYLLLAVGPSGRVSFGNAPVQFCNWQQVLADTGAQTMLEFYQQRGLPVGAKDLRLFAARFSKRRGITNMEVRPESDGIHVDLASDSLLVDLDSRPPARYRVMNYDPHRMESFHGDGRHTYVINRNVLEADVVFNLSKLKTHEKVGITCALKGFVGAVGHKDSLPHHRFGPPEIGGDEYPGDRTGLLRILSGVHDRVQSTPRGSGWSNVLRVTDRYLRIFASYPAPLGEGAWWGNDTAWRMVLDLARIVKYANSTGRMQELPARKLIHMIDGVVGGEGNGPYFPTAYHSGLLLFSDNAVAADYVAALLMGFSPDRIPLLRAALSLSRYPLLERSLSDERVICEGEPQELDKLWVLGGHAYAPPPGWVGRLSADQTAALVQEG